MKAVTAAQLSMASHGIYRVTLDEAIEAMRLTAADMSVKYKETSLSVRLPFGCFDADIYTWYLTGSRREYKCPTCSRRILITSLRPPSRSP